MATKQKKAGAESESFWPKFKRRIKHDRKLKSFTVEIANSNSSAGRNPEALVKILSVSPSGDVIPVRIVSPIGKPAEISVKTQKSKEDGVTKPAHRSWVRIVVRAFGVSTNRNRNGNLPPGGPSDDEETTDVGTPKAAAAQEARNDARRDSTQGPVDQQFPAASSSEAKVIKAKQQKLKSHASAPVSPVKSSRPINIHRLSVTSKGTSSTAIFQSVNLTAVKEEGYDAAVRASVLIIMLLCLVFFGKLVAIFSTSVWWYALPKLTRTDKFQGPPDPKQRRRKVMTKSLSNDYIDLQSSEYRKKVIMEGILQRNHRAGA